MPTYSYRCPNGHDFDLFERKITTKSRTKCPECGKMATRQISGGTGLVFKGSGFYSTDYKSGSKEDGGEKKGQEIPKGQEGSSKGESKGEKSESSAPPAPAPSSKKKAAE